MQSKKPKKPVHRERHHHKYSDEIMDLYNGKCSLCGGRHSDTIDHIVPVAWGGADHPANLKPAHRSCNSSKGADRPPRWTWTKPVMWEPGFGANVEGTVRVPHWDYAGVKTFLLFIFFGAVLAWIGSMSNMTLLYSAGILVVVTPAVFNVILLIMWRRSCRKATAAARMDGTITDPQEWLRDAFSRKDD